MSHIDFAPLANLAITFLCTVLTLIAPVIALKLVQLLHLQGDDKARSVIASAIENGVALGKARAAEAIASGVNVDVKNAVIANAMDYVLPKVPDAMKRLNVTPEGVASRIEAKLATPRPDATVTLNETKS
jgi:hypothetical protein